MHAITATCLTGDLGSGPLNPAAYRSLLARYSSVADTRPPSLAGVGSDAEQDDYPGADEGERPDPSRLTQRLRSTRGPRDSSATTATAPQLMIIAPACAAIASRPDRGRAHDAETVRVQADKYD